MIRVALEEMGEGGRLSVLVDNPAARDNVSRFARTQGYMVEVTEEPQGRFRLAIHKPQAQELEKILAAMRPAFTREAAFLWFVVAFAGFVTRTDDFGEIVFNLIRIGQMRKTPSDTRVDFENVFDFDAALKQEFKIKPPKEP